ncbi:MAG: Flp pilus assembly protein CpaB, partial [Planctomycetota bacterium]
CRRHVQSLSKTRFAGHQGETLIPHGSENGEQAKSKLTRDLVKTDRILIDRVVKTKIKAAQPISTLDLFPPNQGPPLKVGAGMRAVTISLADGVAAVDGLVKAEDYVDIQFVPAYYRDLSRNGGMIMTLFKGIKVIAVNRSVTGIADASRGANTVTLEMTPDHANVLLLASRKGQLNLTYTPDGKAENQFVLREQDRAYLDEILGLKTPDAPKVEEPKRPTVTELFAGKNRTLTLFKDGLRSDRWAIERSPLTRPAALGGGSGEHSTMALEPIADVNLLLCPLIVEVTILAVAMEGASTRFRKGIRWEPISPAWTREISPVETTPEATSEAPIREGTTSEALDKAAVPQKATSKSSWLVRVSREIRTSPFAFRHHES